MFFSECFTIDFSFFKTNITFVCDHTLPFGKDKNEDLSTVERDIKLLHGETVMDFEGEMIKEDCFVSFEKKPVFDLSDNVLFALGLLVFLCYWLVDVLLFRFVGVTWMHHRDLLIVDVIGQLQLLNDLLVLEIDLVHLGRHIQLVLRSLLSQTHRAIDVVGLPLLLGKKLKGEDVLPWDTFLRCIF